MKTIRFLWPLLAIFALTLWVGACSDDDPADPGGGNPPDTTAPQVIGNDPENSEAGVDVGEVVTIVFSEAMNPATSDGAVTLSAGAITATDWANDRTLQVEHDDWSEAAQITVTVGTGLTDVAGNPLAAEHTFSFWTESPGQLLLLETTPADGATDINRDGVILLQFSDSVRPSTLEDHVTITDTPLAKTTYGFEVENIDSGLYVLAIDETLPEDTDIFVFVGADVATWGGTTLGATETFDFTTGMDVDETPPTIILAEPANGNMSVAANVGFLRLTFSEAMNPGTFEPSNWSLGFYFLMMESEISPSWSEGGTVLTIPLPAPLPDGMPMVATFVGFEDLAGNAQETPYVWDVKVAGTADYVPVVDGAQFMVEEDWSEGDVGNETPLDDGDWNWFQQMEVQGDGSFHMVDYEDPGFNQPGDWEAYRKTSSALQWLGFFEAPDAPMKEMFDSPLNILPLPIAAGTWSDQTTVTINGGDGDMQFRASLEGRVLPKADYLIPEAEGEVFIKDAWTVLRHLEVEVNDGGDWVMAMTEDDTTWYAPSLGEVKVRSMEVDHEDDTWYESILWRFPWVEDMMDKSASANNFGNPLE